MKISLLAAASLAAIVASYAPAFAQSDDSSSGDSTQAVQENGGSLDMSSQTALIEAEAQSEVASATAAAAAALDRLDYGKVNPVPVNTPPGVTIAAPAAPARPLPPIDYSKLPPELARPVTIKWDGPVDGAIKQIAQQIDYQVIPSAVHAITPPSVHLDETAVPAARLFEEIGARVSQFGYIHLDPNRRTVELVVKPAAGN